MTTGSADAAIPAPETPQSSVPRRVLPTWITAAITGFFGLFYAYAVWNAIGFLVSQATGPLGLNGAGWALLLAAIVFPMVVFGLAFAFGRRRTVGVFALVMFAGLTLVSVFWLNVLAYATVGGATLLGG